MSNDYFSMSLVDRVGEFLRKYPKTRDDDDYLIKLIWYYACKNPEKMTAMELLSMELPKTETIVRARRKLQEQNGELRGEKYKKRKEIAKKVKMEINSDNEKWIV